MEMVNTVKTLSTCDRDALMKEAGRELAAFLLAVEQTQGATYVEIAGAIWIQALMHQPSSDFSSHSSFRRVTVEAASSLASVLDPSSPGIMRCWTTQ